MLTAIHITIVVTIIVAVIIFTMIGCAAAEVVLETTAEDIRYKKECIPKMTTLGKVFLYFILAFLYLLYGISWCFYKLNNFFSKLFHKLFKFLFIKKEE